MPTTNPSPSDPSLELPERPRLVRLRDIAELAGVHITTVSSVLSPRSTSHTRVSEKTALRIRELAKRLNYRPHLHAQIMRKRKTGVIGLIEFGRVETHSRRMSDLVRAVRAKGYQVLTTNVLWYDETNESSGTKAAIDYILGSQVEGVILVAPPARMPPERVYEIQEAGVPCVAFNGIYLPGVPQVRSDVENGAKALTEHLLALGRKRLALVTTWATASKDESTCWTTLERVAGFKAAIEKAGGVVGDGMEWLGRSSRTPGPVGATLLDSPTMELYSDAERGYQSVRRLLEAGERPDAIVCGNDRRAIGAMRACLEKGVKIPDEIAVVGFAGDSDMKFLYPALTTVDTLAFANAEAVLDLLLEIIRAERPLKENFLLKLPCQLVVRESCGVGLRANRKSSGFAGGA